MDAGNVKSSDSRQICHHVVQRLIQQYGWNLLAEAEFVEVVFNSKQQDGSQTGIEYAAKHHYALALYQACVQAEEPSRCEQGYRELFHYLFRLAYNRWPDLAEDFIEDVTQRALLLVHEQLDKCQNPAAFFTFAAFKLRHAFQQEQQARRPPPEPPPADKTPESPVASYLSRRETERILLEALRQLPDERQQQALFLKFFAGLSDREIAGQLSVSENNVRVLRTRALTRLRNDETLRSYFRDTHEPKSKPADNRL